MFLIRGEEYSWGIEFSGGICDDKIRILSSVIKMQHGQNSGCDSVTAASCNGASPKASLNGSRLERVMNAGENRCLTSTCELFSVSGKSGIFQ